MSDQLDMPVRQAGKFFMTFTLVDSMEVTCFYPNLFVTSNEKFLIF